MKLREIKFGLMLLLPWQEAWAAEAFSFNRAHLHGAAQVDLQKYQYGNPQHALGEWPGPGGRNVCYPGTRWPA